MSGLTFHDHPLHVVQGPQIGDTGRSHDAYRVRDGTWFTAVFMNVDAYSSVKRLVPRTRA